uniref:Protein-tyrosine sulfotransferase n=1 Tax=Alexandrium catenella TaxID=2925 RepID=A0A7S1Q1E2_ALECA
MVVFVTCLHLLLVAACAVNFQGAELLNSGVAVAKGSRRFHAPQPLPTRVTGRASPFRLALFKFQRTGSTFFMEAMQQAVCRDAGCRRYWQAEIFTEICGEGQNCKAEEAVRQVQRYARCAEGQSSCGWSLNLLRHGNMGLHVWDRIVEAISAQPTHVVFLTRENVAAQFLSYKVGSVRRDVMRRPELRRVPGNLFYCNAFHFSACSRAQRDWVDKHTYFEVDRKQLNNSIEEYERNNRIYQHLESQLRGLNNPNVTVVHLDYDDLFREETWQTLFRAAGLMSAPPPTTRPQSDYSGFVSNWNEAVQQAWTRGYNITTI